MDKLYCKVDFDIEVKPEEIASLICSMDEYQMCQMFDHLAKLTPDQYIRELQFLALRDCASDDVKSLIEDLHWAVNGDPE